MVWLNKEYRKKLKDAREELYKYGELKKPTYIIIFTDSYYSYSATSVFTKGFQNTGGYPCGVQQESNNRKRIF